MHESQYVVEKTVSLNSEILSYLAERKDQQPPVQYQRDIQ